MPALSANGGRLGGSRGAAAPSGAQGSGRFRRALAVSSPPPGTGDGQVPALQVRPAPRLRAFPSAEARAGGRVGIPVGAVGQWRAVGPGGGAAGSAAGPAALPVLRSGRAGRAWGAAPGDPAGCGLPTPWRSGAAAAEGAGKVKLSLHGAGRGRAGLGLVRDDDTGSVPVGGESSLLGEV